MWNLSELLIVISANAEIDRWISLISASMLGDIYLIFRKAMLGDIYLMFLCSQRHTQMQMGSSITFNPPLCFL